MNRFTGYLVALFALLTSVNAYFYVPNFAQSLPFKNAMAYAQVDNSLYLYGGETSVSRYTNELYKLTKTETAFSWETVNQANQLEGSSYSKAYVTADKQNLVVVGGDTNQTVGRGLPMQINVFNFASQSWTPGPNNDLNITGTPPAGFLYNKQSFSLNFDSKTQNAYLFGGALAGGSIAFNDFHVLDSSLNARALPSTPYPRYGHTASLLSDGKLVVFGGIIRKDVDTMASTNSVWIFDTNNLNGTWTEQPILPFANGQYPSVCFAHSAVVSSDDRITIFGGDNAYPQRFRQYLNTVSILDTKTWSWIIPDIAGIPPSRRSYAAAAIFDDKLTVAFGSSSNSYYNDINVFDLTKSSWLQSFEGTSSNGDGSVSKGLIAGVTVAAVVLFLIILFLLWKFQSYVRWLITRIHHDIWKPRTGEPVWAETSRVIAQVFFIFLFALFLVFIIKQAIDSPNITQRIEKPSAAVEVPDVRFCFDGYPPNASEPKNGDLGNPGVSCQTNTGYSCTPYIQRLNMNVFSPTFSDHLGPVDCYLFRAPDEFQLSATSGQNNGSRLLFTMFGDETATFARVHVAVYPKRMDPNAKVYNVNDTIPVYLSEAQVLDWQNNERNDLQATNIYTIAPFTYNSLSYTLVEHKYLQDVGWNYVGFLPVTNSTPEIDTVFRSGSPNPNYSSNQDDLGVLSVMPSKYAHYSDREIKMYTLMNAIGFVGGIFGILIGAQAWLFGYRPRSPWGVIHRWSTGSRKQSLLSGLQSKFKTTDSGIPLVHPVHHRFSVNELQTLGQETDSQRVSRVEERMQILELLFKAYYVDDEVFRSLDYASTTNNRDKTANKGFAPPGGQSNVENNSGINNGSAVNPFYQSAEKLTPSSFGQTPNSDPNSFSHYFNERGSRGNSITQLINKSVYRDFYTTFTSTPYWPHRHQHSNEDHPCRILILDSSFNPPTKAHENLFLKALDSHPPHYFDSSLLLFSTRNVDKDLHGASVLQRVQMMEIMARTLEPGNIAVGLTSHGKFVDKAKVIDDWYHQLPRNKRKLELYFIVGYDTVVRLFDPKYYAPESVNEALEPFFRHHHLIWANRKMGDESLYEMAWQNQASDKIHQIELDPEVSDYSSTKARESIRMNDLLSFKQMVNTNIAHFILNQENSIYL
ncbi:hypothetical protein BDB01DRAFT_718454 [Pilobolus umbonatus]|nr:hypothetical protein BDB01DRAFT_718454 [Pilobolus umbonatus]